MATAKQTLETLLCFPSTFWRLLVRVELHSLLPHKHGKVIYKSELTEQSKAIPMILTTQKW